MAQYDVYAQVTISKYLGTYEAENSDEAEDRASQDLPGQLCHHCESRIGGMGDWTLNAARVTKTKRRRRTT